MEIILNFTLKLCKLYYLYGFIKNTRGFKQSLLIKINLYWFTITNNAPIKIKFNFVLPENYLSLL